MQTAMANGALVLATYAAGSASTTAWCRSCFNLASARTSGSVTSATRFEEIDPVDRDVQTISGPFRASRNAAV